MIVIYFSLHVLCFLIIGLANRQSLGIASLCGVCLKPNNYNENNASACASTNRKGTIGDANALAANTLVKNETIGKF